MISVVKCDIRDKPDEKMKYPAGEGKSAAAAGFCSEGLRNEP